MIIAPSLLERGIKKSIAAAINATARDMKKEFIRAMVRTFGVNVKGATLIANTRFKIKRATEHRLIASIRPRRRMVPLILFNAEQDRSMPGTSIEYYRGQKQILPHAFIPARASGERYISPTTGMSGVYKRIPGSQRTIVQGTITRNTERITLQGGVPVKQMFREVAPDVDKMLPGVLDRNLQKQLTKVIK